MSPTTSLRGIVGNILASEMNPGNKRVDKQGRTCVYATPVGEPWLHYRFVVSERIAIVKRVQAAMIAEGYPCEVEMTIGSVKAILAPARFLSHVVARDVERIAKAICGSYPDGLIWEHQDRRGRDDFRRAARAAIDALRD